jgi:hypothetical protein
MTFEWYNNIQHFDFLAVAGSFPNEAVVKLAAEKLKAEEGKPVDPAQVPRAPKCNTSGDSFFCKLSKRSDLRWSKTSFHILQGFWIWIQHESDRQNLVSSILNTYQYYPPNTPFLALCALAGCYRGLPWGPKQLFIMQPAFDKHTVIPPWRHSRSTAVARVRVGLDSQAIKCGSKDNLSCMIVLLGGGEVTYSAVASCGTWWDNKHQWHQWHQWISMAYYHS